jgi:hypothetical protein
MSDVYENCGRTLPPAVSLALWRYIRLHLMPYGAPPHVEARLRTVDAGHRPLSTRLHAGAAGPLGHGILAFVGTIRPRCHILSKSYRTNSSTQVYRYDASLSTPSDNLKVLSVLPAIDRSCVTAIIVVSCERASSCRSSNMCSPVCVSRFPVGSSAKINFG